MLVMATTKGTVPCAQHSKDSLFVEVHRDCGILSTVLGSVFASHEKCQIYNPTTDAVCHTSMRKGI